jgi:chaperonin cofactor prefoldin
MGMSKKDLSKAKAKLKAKIEELEAKVRVDPLKKNPRNHEELAKLKKELEES